MKEFKLEYLSAALTGWTGSAFFFRGWGITTPTGTWADLGEGLALRPHEEA
jgi:hypothetical protein